MASALLRRSAVTAGLAAVATIASPLVGTALADAPALTAATFTTSPADSSGTVKANTPTFTATYNTAISGSSTISLTDTSASNANVTCPGSINGSAISCQPSSNLVDGHSYTVSVHAFNAATPPGDNRTDTKSYTIDIPSLVASTPTQANPSPSDGDVVGSGSTPIRAQYDESLDGTSFIRITDKDGNFIQGGSLSSSLSPVMTNDILTFTPPVALPAGTYEVHIHAVAAGNSLAFADDFLNYTVNSNLPTQAPTVTTAGASLDNGATHWINANNESAVPFKGMAEPNVRVKVVIYDPSDPKVNCNHTSTLCQNDRTANVGVNDCGNPTCPWSLGVDTATKNTPDAAYKFYYFAYTQAGSAPATPGPGAGDTTITKDTTVPTPPLGGTLTIPNGSNSASITDPATDNTTYAYKVDLADNFGHHVIADNLPADNQSQVGSPNPSIDHDLNANGIDVSALEDGASGSTPAPQIKATVWAYDKAGNISSQPDLATPKSNKESTTLLPDLAHSFVTVDGSNITLANINGKTIHSPTSVTIKFDEPIRSQLTSSTNGDPPLYTTHMNLLSASGFPISGSLAISADQKSFTWTLTGTPTDTGSPYSITDLAAVAATCADKASTTAGCEEWPNDTDSSLTESGDLAHFSIDNTAPSVHVLGVNGSGDHGINADTIGSTVINGSVSSDATSVTLAIKPASGSTILVPSGSVSITPPSGGASSTTWQTSALNLSALSDGPATITASATDAAGNSSPVDPSANNPDSTSRSFSTTVKARPDAPTNFTALAGNGQATLGWTAPTNTGAADKPITSYSLTYTDTSVPGSTAVTAPSPSGSATSATVSGLANGHTYSFALSASNGSFSSPTVTTTATPKGNTSLSAIGPGTINYGTFIAVHGTLSYFGVGVANKPVTVTTVNFNGTHGRTYNVTTDQNGGWVIAGLSPTKNTGYVASFAGDSSYNPSSGVARVYVRVALALKKATARTTSHVSPVTLHGTIKPSQTGRRVYIYERRANGSLRYLGYCKVSSRGTWVFTRTFAKGKHTVVARFLSQNGNIGRYSNRLRFSRT